MVLANLIPIINLVIFTFYIIFAKDKQSFPEQIIYWPWLLYIFNIIMDHYFDSMQNTSRNIIRICLIKRYNLDYNPAVVHEIQELLIPNSIFPLVLLWQLIQIISFTSILFFQGWCCAILSELGLLIFPLFIPINYK